MNPAVHDAPEGFRGLDFSAEYPSFPQPGGEMNTFYRASHENSQEYNAGAAPVPDTEFMDLHELLSQNGIAPGAYPGQEYQLGHGASHTPGHGSGLASSDAYKDEPSTTMNPMHMTTPDGYGHAAMYSPLDAAAITPASVFSTVSSASTNDFFSPLTSPALQPQESHLSHPVYSLNDSDLLMLHQHPDMASAMSSPSHPHVRMSPFQGTPARSGYMRPPGYATESHADLAAVTSRRNRSATAENRANKVRPSPLMKPVQSPKTFAANGVAHAKRRDTSSGHPSPSLNAIASLSGTMQEAHNLAMPSPAMSPVRGEAHTLAHAHSASTLRQPLPHTGDEHNASSSRPRSAGLVDRQSDHSPSPIELAPQGTYPHQPAPVTPSTIMGIAQSVPAGAHAHAAHGHGMPDAQRTNCSPHSAAAQAVASSALVNAAHRAATASPASFQPKSILPGTLSSEDRNAWMHLRRIGNGGMDQRRTSHKAAEQKRRDSLKNCFDDLRSLLPAITLDETIPTGSVLGPDGSPEDQRAEGFDPEATQRPVQGDADPVPEGTRQPLYVTTPEQAREANRAIAKVLLLRHSNEYLVRLKQRIERRDAALHSLSQEVVRLRTALAETHGAAAKAEDASVSQNFGSLRLATAESQGGSAHSGAST